MTSLSQRIGMNVKAAREAVSGRTQEDVARAAGVSVGTVARLEQGKTTRPREDEFQRIAEALGTTPNALMGIDDERQSDGADGEPTDEELDAELAQRTSNPDILLAFMARVRDPKKMSRRAKIVILEDLRKIDPNRRQG